jgi:DNA (cytosine-5)-methyltransferase 1
MGMTHVLSVDSWQTALDSCIVNTNGNVLLADLSEDASAVMRKAGIPSLFGGLVWMSPPCQGFSAQRAEQAVDYRNSLLPLSVSNVAANFPKSWIIVENVVGFLSAHRTPERLLLARNLHASRGVALHDDVMARFVLRAPCVGVPQSRRRLFLPIPPRGKGIPSGFEDLRAEKNLTIAGAIRKLVPGDVCDYASPRLTARESEIFDGMPPGGNWRSTPAARRYAKEKFGNGTAPESFLRRSAWDDLPACVMATVRVRLNTGSFMHPKKSRRLNLAELRAFQSIPSDFFFYGDVTERVRQIGNAVPPPMTREAVGLIFR